MAPSSPGPRPRLLLRSSSKKAHSSSFVKVTTSDPRTRICDLPSSSSTKSDISIRPPNTSSKKERFPVRWKSTMTLESTETDTVSGLCKGDFLSPGLHHPPRFQDGNVHQFS